MTPDPNQSELKPYLLPCPFCGGPLKTQERRPRVGAFVTCNHCVAQGPTHCTAQEARDGWNTRTPDASLLAKLAAMEEAVKYYLAGCPNCGGVGHFVTPDENGEPEMHQCQWCDTGLIALSTSSPNPILERLRKAEEERDALAEMKRPWANAYEALEVIKKESAKRDEEGRSGNSKIWELTKQRDTALAELEKAQAAVLRVKSEKGQLVEDCRNLQETARHSLAELDAMKAERDALRRALQGLLDNYKENGGKGLGIGPIMQAKAALAGEGEKKATISNE